jgi:outer membrane protein TolC
MDAAIEIEHAAIADYRRSLTITTNRFKAGIAPHSDALQAETVLASAPDPRASSGGAPASSTPSPC